MLINKLISLFFRLVFFTMIITNYIHYIFFIWYPIAKTNHFAFIPIFILNFLMIMLIWTIYISMNSDPGSVPLYWGFYFGDSDIKRKRYCLMCNVFKPDRCHHCSVCNKCILNMDHHCPWINNCIGFFNRKFFIQMLFYINANLIFINFSNGKFVYDIVKKIINNKVNVKKDLTEHLTFLVIYFADFLLMFFIGSFFKFHLKLVFDNKTTIETIDKKGDDFNSMYSIGRSNNWKQVMGNSKLLWFFPFRIHLGAPEGNGIDWDVTSLDEKKLNMMNSNYQSQYNTQQLNQKNEITLTEMSKNMNTEQNKKNVNNFLKNQNLKTEIQTNTNSPMNKFAFSIKEVNYF